MQIVDTGIKILTCILMCPSPFHSFHLLSPQAIQDHRRTSRNPLYWTNRDVYDWLKDIQLQVCGKMAQLELEEGS